MERFDTLELSLMRRYSEQVYVRDQATARLLHKLDIEQVRYLGNPMLDQVAGGRVMARHHEGKQPVVAMLPGTRAYKYKALETMMAAFRELPSGTGLLAWSGGLLPLFSGWTRVTLEDEDFRYIYRHDTKEVFVYENRFFRRFAHCTACAGYVWHGQRTSGSFR